MKDMFNPMFVNHRKWLLLFFIGLMSMGVYAQRLTVTGTVIGADDNLPLPTVSVVIKGTTTGTSTDFDGKYSIQVEKGKTLVFSFMGMQTQEVQVQSSKHDVYLESSATLLTDVVVVGFGTQKKETVVGSVTQAKGEELLKAGSVTTVSEALTGILPGVSTMQAAGQPGSTNSTILIRGQSSWSNNTPLFMVDGVEMEDAFNDIDPNEIESISVLKDASATAVYGVKAANGVILITTKRGTKGKPSVTFSSNWGVKTPVIETDYMKPYGEALQYRNEAALNDLEYGKLKSRDEINAWLDPNRDTDLYSYTNWINDMVQEGYTQSYNLNISGGNDIVRYFTSFGYNYDGDLFDVEKQKDFDPRTYQKRYNWRSNLDFNLTKTTKFRINFSGNFKDWHGNRVTASGGGIAEDGSALQRMYQWTQVGAPPVFKDGTLGVDQNIATDWNKYNFLGEMERGGERTKRTTTMNTNIILEQRFLNDFLFKGKVAYIFDRAYTSGVTASPLYYEIDPISKEKQLFGSNKDQVEALLQLNDEELDAYKKSMYYEASLLYEKTLGDHNVSALGLVSWRKRRSKAAFPSFEHSYVARATYGYKMKYLAEFNGAYNGSEKFAEGQRFGFFPSLALGWVVSEEEFIKKKLNFIDFFKIRLSIGSVGSEAGADRFTYISQYESRTYGGKENNSHGGFGHSFTPAGSQDGTIFYEGKPANPTASWEVSIKRNLGFELAFLGSKLKTNIDLFNEDRSVILMTRKSVANWFGNVAPDANLGETKNQGIDIELTYQDNIGKDWSYRLSGNISLSENRILFRDDLIYTPENEKNAGKPIGWGSGLLNNGIMQNWDDVYNTPQSSGATRIPGDFTFTDFNGDGLINDRDRVPIGKTSYASKTYAFSLYLKYKGLSVNAMFNGMFDLYKGLSSGYLWEYETQGGENFRMLNTEMQDYWTPTNPGASHPALHLINNRYNSMNSLYAYRPADFLRLRSLEVKYKFPTSLLKHSKAFQALEVYVNGNNLYTWQKLPKQFDPEATKLEVYPISKRYNIGVRATF